MELKNKERLFCWPMKRHIITAGWTYNSGAAHGALDFRADVGTPVYACEGGVVDWVQHWNGWQKTGNQSYGTLIRIRHQDYKGRPLYTLYAHLSAVAVKQGQRVTEGQQIGLSGNTGNSFGAHLHFEVQYGGTGSARRVHPLNWLNGDFQCASAAVRSHLGSYKSVVQSGTTVADEQPTAKPVVVGSLVIISPGAKYGGMSASRGKTVPSSCCTPNRKYIVSKVAVHNGVNEALLQGINSWIAITSLTVV